MYVTPTSELATAVRENLRRAVLDKKSCWEFSEIEPSDKYRTSFKILDKNNIIMYATRVGVTYMLNNFNGPAFYHINGDKKMLFINNVAYSEFDYNRHYAIKFIKSLQLKDPTQPMVSDGVYRLKQGYLRITTGYDNNLRLTVHKSNGDFHNDNGPAVVDYTNGQIIYYTDGVINRPVYEGPAVINRKRGGKDELEIQEEYYTKGRKLTQGELEILRKQDKQTIQDIEDIDIPDF